jgi:hypothetical protein
MGVYAARAGARTPTELKIAEVCEFDLMQGRLLRFGGTARLTIDQVQRLLLPADDLAAN